MKHEDEKQVKLYVFYKILDGRGELMDPPYLYAYTTDKKLKEEFETQRDTSRFHMVVRELPKSKAKEFRTKFPHNYLVEMPYYTQSEFGTRKRVDVLTTWEEYNFIFTKTDNIMIELGKYVSDSYDALKKSYQEALNVIGYENVFKFIITRDYFEDYRDQVSIELDEFNLYLRFFGDTYKK